MILRYLVPMIGMETDSSSRFEIDTLLLAVASTIRAALNTAYDAGLVAGRKAMIDEMKAKLGNFLDEAVEPTPMDQAAVPEQDTAPDESAPVRKHAWSDREKRAERGSVRPIVRDWLKNTDEGCRPFDIAKETGLNESSIRGALNILRTQGLAEKHGDLWFKAAPSGSTSNDKLQERRLLDDDEPEEDEWGYPLNGDSSE